MVVLSTALGAEMQPLIERLHGIETTRGGTIDASHDWGKRRLAYPIKKQGDGHYFLIEYSAGPDAVSEVERSLRITDGVLRYLTVQQEHTGLPKPRERELPRGEVPMHEMRSVGATAGTPSAAPAASEATTPVQTPAAAPTASSSGDASTEPAAVAEPESSSPAEQGQADGADAAPSDDGVKTNE